MTVERIGVSLEGPLLADFDRYIAREGFGSRSEGLRNLIREALTRRRSQAGGRVVGTITIVYRHEVGMVTHRILHRQHEFLGFIRATAHTHLDEETCLEVLIVEGDARRVATLANRLKTVKGVLSAETVVASPKVR
jgi:CopG family nickel-responsive transcriptional regulator